MGFDAFRNAEKEGWHARAGGYDATTGQVTTRAIATLLAMAEAAPGKRLLDLCCGTGRGAGAAAALGAQAEGIDVAPGMVAAARVAFPGVPFDEGDAEAIPREDGIFDAVICSFGVLHVGNPGAMFADIARVLKPGGRVALSHWVGPPESDFFRVVFGAIGAHADMSAVPPSPPPFALSTEVAMTEALEAVGFGDVRAERLPLEFRAPEGRFAKHFRVFSARSAVILDVQDKGVMTHLETAWEEGLAPFLRDGEYRVPMPAMAVTAVRS